MKYRLMTENDLEYVVEKNNEYYNNVEGCWTLYPTELQKQKL